MKKAMGAWVLLVILGVVFLAVGVVVIVLGLAGDQPWVAALGALPVLVALKIFWDAVQTRREASMPDVAAPTTPPGGVPWSEVEQRLRARFTDDKYTVTAQGSTIRIEANLANAAYFTLGGAKKVQEVRGVEISATKPGQAITRDYVKSAAFFAGKGAEQGTWRFTGDAEFSSGRSWNYTKSIEFGANRDGVGKKVDIDYNTNELHKPVKEILKETGWYAGFYRSLPAEARGALVMAALGASALPIVGILALLGKF